MDRRFPMARMRIVCALLAALVGVAGCGIKRIPTGGKVTLDGEPLKEGVLQFIPDVSKGNNLRVSCSGPISNGRRNLVTSGVERADTGTGAPVGWFKVRYIHPNEASKQQAQSAAPKAPAKYYREETTPLSIELTDPPPAEGYTIELTSK